MINRLRRWLEDRNMDQCDPPPAVRAPAARKPPLKTKARAQPGQQENEDFSPKVAGTIQDGGPGKNVLIRNRYIREDTGTHDTLKIIDDSVLESDDEDGADPYNTGHFDRSKSWNLRTRK